MQTFYLLLAFLGGVVLPVQIGLNAMVGRAANPVWATSISFLIGTVGVILYLLALNQPWPAMATVAALPPYVWLAGLLGAMYVTITIVVAPQIGGALLVSLVVAGQMLAALILDHYGALGFPQHALSWPRVVGALLVVAGVVLIRRF